jgi:hypothetical protein
MDSGLLLSEVGAILIYLSGNKCIKYKFLYKPKTHWPFGNQWCLKINILAPVKD